MRHTGHDHRGVTADAVARVEAGEDDPACLMCRGILKSAAVMFGERPDAVVPGESVSAAKAAQVFFAVAGKLQVRPAAALTGLGTSPASRRATGRGMSPGKPGRRRATTGPGEVVREPSGTALPRLPGELTP
ncbi:hypothetical protein AB0M68_02280 [Streptomyces sp. NPDC051453]|uniref:hypothetical protein n=1 Tax=Streptomyces sp. NPDC051453 TaxID=3154941 RepID=UPI0034373982